MNKMDETKRAMRKMIDDAPDLLTGHKCGCSAELKEWKEEAGRLNEINHDLSEPMTSFVILQQFFKRGFMLYGINGEGAKYCKFMIGDKEPELIIRLSEMIHEHEQTIIKTQKGETND